jgi:hypothetical protein
MLGRTLCIIKSVGETNELNRMGRMCIPRKMDESTGRFPPTPTDHSAASAVSVTKSGRRSDSLATQSLNRNAHLEIRLQPLRKPR